MDAAVCGTFASCIAEIGLVHLGGSGVAQIYDPRARESVVYNFFSRTLVWAASPGPSTWTSIGQPSISAHVPRFKFHIPDFNVGGASGVKCHDMVYNLCQHIRYTFGG